jgi:hypothetical protein
MLRITSTNNIEIRFNPPISNSKKVRLRRNGYNYCATRKTWYKINGNIKDITKEKAFLNNL